jgi:hypothetical protein
MRAGRRDRINFRNKADNAVMVDDNPVERAAIQAGLPRVRVLGKHPYAQVAGNPAPWSRPPANPLLCPAHLSLGASRLEIERQAS